MCTNAFTFCSFSIHTFFSLLLTSSFLFLPLLYSLYGYSLYGYSLFTLVSSLFFSLLFSGSTASAQEFDANARIKQKQQQAKTQERLVVRRKLKMSKTMQKVPGFGVLGDASMSKIIDKMNMEKFGGNNEHLTKIVCRAGDVADRLYVIMSGTVEIIVNGTKVRDMIENDFFGEGSLITGEHERGATVNAVAGDGIVTTLTLSKESFNQLVSENIITQTVVTTLKERHLKWKKEDENRSSTTALVQPPPPMMSGLSRVSEGEEHEEEGEV